jgi:hypothetical protein
MLLSNRTPFLVRAVLYFLLETTAGREVTAFFVPANHFFHHPTNFFNAHRNKNTPNWRFVYGSTTLNAANEVGTRNDRDTNELSNRRVINNRSSHDEVFPSAERKATHNNHFELPWSDVQEFVLHDKLPSFIVRVAHGQQLQSLILWRNLLLDTPELSGYPIPFVVQKLEHLLQKNRDQNNDMNSRSFMLLDHLDFRRVLPYLDEYEFQANGGLKGIASGVPGVADGTLIQTTPVENVSETVPRGYVTISSPTSSSDAVIMYELGKPKIIAENGRYYQRPEQDKPSLDGKFQFLTKMANQRDNQDGSPVDTELINLGALTAIIIGGAMAAQSLSHHLTINVFWV